MIKTANRIAGVEEYYFSRKLAEVRAMDRAWYLSKEVSSPFFMRNMFYVVEYCGKLEV